ncbi:hypothetical protein HK100_007314 [Physocladia obscura]|uniref:NADP-dependent oxidoreductase domain-containing protein n=1 Tax=Physocladia obscura TaxID=109957 RepID=A0AAD5SQI8_9FUNG|nr:hypothetical protein HK100_007314 [Physocladia obscura]
MTSFTNEPLIPRIGFGAMGFSPANREESLSILQRLADTKSAFIDTADGYGLGYSEELIGEWLRQNPGNRSKVFLCTKFGFRGWHPFVICGTPEYVKSACEASLKRLGVDTIDLYYQHRVDPDTPIEDTVTAMAELVKEGKVRYLGLSEASAETIRRAHKIHPIAAVQVDYSPWSTFIEHNDVFATCEELGIAVVACKYIISPLGLGFLTGQYKSVDDFAPNDLRRSLPRFQVPAFAENLRLIDAFKKIADAKGCTVTQLTLAWVCAQGPHVIPIPGTTKLSKLEDNLGATSVFISESENAAIREILNSIPIVGEAHLSEVLALSWK